MSLYKSALNSSRAAASARNQQQPSPSAHESTGADSAPSSGFTTPTDSFIAPHGGPALRQPADAVDLASGVRAQINQFAGADAFSAASSRPTTPAEHASPSASKPARRLFPNSRDSSFLASSQDVFLTPRSSGTPNGPAAGTGGPGVRLGGIENLAKAGTPSTTTTKLHPLQLGGSFAGVSVAAAPAQQHPRIMGASIEAIMAPFTLANHSQRDHHHHPQEDDVITAPFHLVPTAIPDLALDLPAGRDGISVPTRLRPGDFVAHIPGGGRANGDPLAPRPISHLGGAESASALMINVPSSTSDPPANALGADRSVLPHNRSFSALMPTSELFLGPELGQSPSTTVASKASIMALAPKSPRSGATAPRAGRRRGDGQR
ncbi:hypothetical protein AMAG_17900 [Allomyces macrogynus ATCC 38327]|uniref:Uncharacterized protein n=1 Tax=Allomyces macrogynus (strain ATCC 38327) TaxID=578462 RepID=A0A0L0S1N9_ALLM3|nr:hypothetical protein AMAG_17900 [Allomyces macrogynus ATCC 38327]|eukprot:KNE56321.1 hypothetical protein AMAG_17900 [Allomyces macrogynus ATCC 38327]